MARTLIPTVEVGNTTGILNEGIAPNESTNHYIGGGNISYGVLVMDNRLGDDTLLVTVVAGDNIIPAVRKGLGSALTLVDLGELRFIALDMARFIQQDNTVHVNVVASGTGAVLSFLRVDI